MHEVGDPSLVFGAVLMGAVDAALAEHHGVHVEAARVIPNVLVGRALAASVWTVEVERLRLLAGATLVVELSVDLVGRGEDERCLRIVLTRCLEEVEGAAGVDVEIGARIDDRSGHGDLGGEVKDCVLVFDVLRDRGRIPHVLFNECDPGRMLRDEPLQVSFRARAAQVVEDRRVPALPDEVRGRIDSKESCATGDEDATRLGACCHRGHIP